MWWWLVLWSYCHCLLDGFWYGAGSFRDVSCPAPLPTPPHPWDAGQLIVHVMMACAMKLLSVCSVQPPEVLDDFSCYDGVCHDVSHCSSQPSRWSVVVYAVWWHMPWSWCHYHVSFCSVVLCNGMYHEVVIIVVISVLWCCVVECAMKLSLSLQFLFCDVMRWRMPWSCCHYHGSFSSVQLPRCWIPRPKPESLVPSLSGATYLVALWRPPLFSCMPATRRSRTTVAWARQGATIGTAICRCCQFVIFPAVLSALALVLMLGGLLTGCGSGITSPCAFTCSAVVCSLAVDLEFPWLTLCFLLAPEWLHSGYGAGIALCFCLLCIDVRSGWGSRIAPPCDFAHSAVVCCLALDLEFPCHARCFLLTMQWPDFSLWFWNFPVLLLALWWLAIWLWIWNWPCDFTPSAMVCLLAVDLESLQLMLLLAA